ncbi:MAG: DNA polymerase III subunit beta [Spirochaetales bacterium]|nr:DNA polymerase III subunit beta [Spirochaetales bacterium]MBO7348852.1 DNA polymerase III subunit beta [Spirochaetales bacterium]MBP5757102.1 DNA polymerase III subunit beta [Spirochaetales bacterium]
MKFVCNKNNILKELSNALDFTSQRNTLAVYANVCLLLEGNNLTIKATDQKMSYVSEMTVDGLEDGSTTVVCDKFLNIIKNLPDSNIVFEDSDDKIRINPEGTSIEFKLRTIEASAFPSLVFGDESGYFRVSQKDFTDMIGQVIFAVSDDESKYAMNGALLEKDGNGLVMVGTDGRRLSYINRQIGSEIPDFPKATIPSRFLNLIKKLSVGEGDFEINVGSNTISLRFGSCTISSSLIKNDFPAYKRVIPESQSKVCIVNINTLSDALKRVSLLVENKFKKIILEFNENKLTVYCDESEVGAGREEIECKYEGDSQRCAMNYTYLLSPLKVMDGEEARIEFSEPGRPFTVKSEPERDYLHVIMPMNLN